MRLITYSTPLHHFTPFQRNSSLRDFLIPASETKAWTPPLDIQENSDQITVQLEAAGLKKDAIEITLHDDNLTISGERKDERQTTETPLHQERVFGRFSRTVTLPSTVKADAVSASYHDGVLSIVLPRVEEAKPRRIDVTVN